MKIKVIILMWVLKVLLKMVKFCRMVEGKMKTPEVFYSSESKDAYIYFVLHEHKAHACFDERDWTIFIDDSDLEKVGKKVRELTTDDSEYFDYLGHLAHEMEHAKQAHSLGGELFDKLYRQNSYYRAVFELEADAACMVAECKARIEAKQLLKEHVHSIIGLRVAQANRWLAGYYTSLPVKESAKIYKRFAIEAGLI